MGPLQGMYSCLCRRLSCGVLLLFAWTLGQADEYSHKSDGMSYRHFQGIDNIMEVECSGKSLDSSTDLLMVSLFSPHDDTVLASANLKKKECTTSHSFSLCIIDDSGHRTKVKTLVLDLRMNESRLYGCNVTVESAGRPSIRSWAVTVRREKISVTTIAVLSSTTVPSPSVSNSGTPPARSSKSSTSGVDLAPGLLVTGLVFLIFFMALALVLLVVHLKERRRRHYLSDEYDTPLPIKGIDESPAPAPSTSRGIGEKERILCAALTRSPRPSTSSSPHPSARKGSGTGSGGGGSVRYQQTGMLIPHTSHGQFCDHESVHYMSGMSVYYAEPWSGVDSDSKERLRGSSSSRGTSQMSHDSKGGPVTSSAPPADDNA